MYYRSDYDNRRMGAAFFAAFLLHALLFWQMQQHAQRQREQEKVITAVELVRNEPLPERPAPVEEPKSLWGRIKQALPVGGGEGDEKPLAPPKPAERLQRLVEQATEPPQEKLVDRAEPLVRPDKSGLEELKRQRDAKLNELVDASGGQMHKVQQMLTQEQALTDRSEPLVRAAPKVDRGNVIEEVGTRRTDRIADLAQAPAPSTKKDTVQELGVSQLVEKKQSLKRQLAALGAAPSMPAGLQDRIPERTSRINDVTGTMKERQKAQEVLALQKLIDEKEPRKPSTASGGGGRGFGGGFGTGTSRTGSGSGAVGAASIRLDEPKDLQVSKPASRPVPPDIPVRAKTPASVERVAEVKKAPVEISGPLEKRQVLAAYAPPYPEWAKRDAIEADVSLRFFVTPQGAVAPEITVVRTSGYSKLDALCVETLRKWLFAPLPPNETQKDQWGVVTLRFRLE